MENLNPRVFEKATNRPLLPEEEDDAVRDEIDSREIFGKLELLASTVIVLTNDNLFG